MNILFVCLGNICRSPMAEGIFQSLVNLQGLAEQIHIDSAGTASYHIGELPDQRARQTCGKKGITLTHRARAFIREDFDRFDYILAMDHQNMKNILTLKSENSKAKVMLMREFDLLEKGAEVPDPYFGGDEGFVEVFDMLERSCLKLLEELKQ